MHHNELLIPEGFYLVETEQVITDATVEFYAFKWVAERRRDQANDARDWVTIRYEAEKTSKAVRKKLGFWSRWAVVPYQNRLEKEQVQ